MNRVVALVLDYLTCLDLLREKIDVLERVVMITVQH